MVSNRTLEAYPPMITDTYQRCSAEKTDENVRPDILSRGRIGKPKFDHSSRHGRFKITKESGRPMHECAPTFHESRCSRLACRCHAASEYSKHVTATGPEQQPQPRERAASRTLVLPTGLFFRPAKKKGKQCQKKREKGLEPRKLQPGDEEKEEKSPSDVAHMSLDASRPSSSPLQPGLH
jgi:hypothetical protein